MIQIQNIKSGEWYNLYAIRFQAVGNSIKGFLDAVGDEPSHPTDGIYKIPSLNDTLIEINSYDEMMSREGIEYNKHNTLECFVMIPRSGQS